MYERIGEGGSQRYTVVHSSPQRSTAIHSDSQQFTVVHSSSELFTAVHWSIGSNWAGVRGFGQLISEFLHKYLHLFVRVKFINQSRVYIRGGRSDTEHLEPRVILYFTELLHVIKNNLDVIGFGLLDR